MGGLNFCFVQFNMIDGRFLLLKRDARFCRLEPMSDYATNERSKSDDIAKVSQQFIVLCLSSCNRLFTHV